MSEPQQRYRLDHVLAVKEQILSIGGFAKQVGKLERFLGILKKAVHLLQTDPHGWGDPEYGSQSMNGVVCHGILRPVVFHYVIYEQVRGVVLLRIRLFADFD